MAVVIKLLTLLTDRGVMAANAHPFTMWSGLGQLVQEKGPI